MRHRTMAFIVAIDCAMSFFQNYPCRLVATELECDLPCEERFFESNRPYSEPGFMFQRQHTILDAFERFFTGEDESATPPALSLTVLDMFIMIHLLYAHLNTQMTLLTPLLHARRSKDVDQHAGMKAIKTAMTMWRNVWMQMRSRITNQEWATMGFWKNSYNYWSVAQLLLSKKDKVDSVLRMEFGEDKLERLKLLLQDE